MGDPQSAGDLAASRCVTDADRLAALIDSSERRRTQRGPFASGRAAAMHGEQLSKPGALPVSPARSQGAR